MKSIPALLVSLLLALGAAVGCSRTAAPPPPLPVEQIPAEFQKVFAKATPAAKDLSGQFTAAVSGKKYPAAFEMIQMLQALPDLTKEQQTLAGRAMITVSSLLQAAQTQGDSEAATSIKQYRSNR